MLIERNASLKNALAGKTVLLTGGGGGIGLEAAKAFAYMGAVVIIAEIDPAKGRGAETAVNDRFGQGRAEFFEVDLAEEDAVNAMCDYISKKYGCPDIVFNNATYIRIGAVDDVDLSSWDLSYRINFKAPLKLAKRFLPAMKKRGSGTVVFVSSSGASPFMGAYEIYKTAQVELGNTLAMELENTNVYAFTIGPGLVKTETAMGAIKVVAERMGMSVDEFYRMNSQHILDVESAGLGFALSALNAANYHGQEIGSIQALTDYDFIRSGDLEDGGAVGPAEKDTFARILKTFKEQYDGWRAMNIFERQWVFRDFKKYMGLSAEQALEKLKTVDGSLEKGGYTANTRDGAFFEKLRDYWKHQLALLQGYQKDKNKLEEHSRVINEWISDLDGLLSHFKSQ